MDDRKDNTPSRRNLMQGAAALAPIALIPGAADAATPNRGALQRVVESQKDDTVARLRTGSAIPTIAAEGAQHPGRRRVHGAPRARRGLRPTSRSCRPTARPACSRPRRRRAEDARRLLHVRREAVRSRRNGRRRRSKRRIVDKANLGSVIMGRGAVNQKGPETRVPRRAARVARRRPHSCRSTSCSSAKARRRSAARISTRSCAGRTSWRR